MRNPRRRASSSSGIYGIQGRQGIQQHVLRTPGGSRPPARCAGPQRPIAGDDADAKATVAAFLDAIGYDTVDVEPLAESWRFEPGAPVSGVVYMTAGQRDVRDSVPAPADAATVRAAVLAARR